jgi:hypothetical protein
VNAASGASGFIEANMFCSKIPMVGSQKSAATAASNYAQIQYGIPSAQPICISSALVLGTTLNSTQVSTRLATTTQSTSVADDSDQCFYRVTNLNASDYNISNEFGTLQCNIIRGV